MNGDIERVIIDRHAIAQRVKELASTIAGDLGSQDQPLPKGLTLVPILSGSFIFVADLIRHLPLLMRIRMLSIVSYPGPRTTSRGARMQSELTHLPHTLQNTHVLLIDDILDTSNTLRLAVDAIQHRQPAALRTCVLLRKQRSSALQFPVDYVAFDVPDKFVVGYGLDFNGYYRNLPDIVTLKAEVLEQAERV